MPGHHLATDDSTSEERAYIASWTCSSEIGGARDIAQEPDSRAGCAVQPP